MPAMQDITVLKEQSLKSNVLQVTTVYKELRNQVHAFRVKTAMQELQRALIQPMDITRALEEKDWRYSVRQDSTVTEATSWAK